jgi:hypothetical protein
MYKCVFQNESLKISCTNNCESINNLFDKELFWQNYSINGCKVEITGIINETLFINARVIISNNAEINAELYCNELELYNELDINWHNCFANNLLIFDNGFIDKYAANNIILHNFKKVKILKLESNIYYVDIVFPNILILSYFWALVNKYCVTLNKYGVFYNEHFYDFGKINSTEQVNLCQENKLTHAHAKCAVDFNAISICETLYKNAYT